MAEMLELRPGIQINTDGVAMLQLSHSWVLEAGETRKRSRDSEIMLINQLRGIPRPAVEWGVPEYSPVLHA
ncbi:fatty acid synthase S-acetyltransferase [Aspergillus luchuensis]|uniref:Fatty acid synthase S-acetyltransferase n=1 Tax=Aspergillus kawachii TaxID=1069201 RepID=A0A146FWV4_ASPKA|nr:fatty acid synthase S-acetyltransferase [Aspergillus luchuensis]